MGAVMKYESLASRFGGIYDVPEAARYLKASEQGKSVYPRVSGQADLLDSPRCGIF